MSQRTLVLLEVTGIQKYVFGSNHLAQNIGASELVMRVTTEWVLEVLTDMQLSSNVSKWEPEQGFVYQADKRIENDLAVEIIYGGGGNAMILFAEDQDAKTFIQHLSQQVLKNAPGLHLVAIRDQFKWGASPCLAEIHTQLREKLANRKHDRPISVPLAGLGVTASCVYTGKPAVGLDNDVDIVGEEAARKAEFIDATPRRISAEVAAKLRMESAGKDRLKAILSDYVSPEYDFVYNFGEFGTPGESSYIAVVHADINQMSERFDQVAASHNHHKANREYINSLRTLSQSIQKRAKDTLRDTVVHLLRSRDLDGNFGGIVSPPVRNSCPLLPFRPIVFGGDDVTFVCDGRLGLILAAHYLQEWTKEPLLGEPLHARAGVAVVKSHYPFSRAYQVAGHLMSSAKNAIDVLKQSDEVSTTTLDWHFSTTGMNYQLEEIREREYTTSTGKSLLMRPIRITPGGRTWRNWDNFTYMMSEFQRGFWAGSKNKVIALHDALRKGADGVRAFRNNYRIDELPDVSTQPDMRTTGWQGEDCGYFDAIEALDFFIPLDETSVQEANTK